MPSGARSVSSLDFNLTLVAGPSGLPITPGEISEYGMGREKRRETSVTVRHGEKGLVDLILLTESVGGNKLPGRAKLCCAKL